MDIAIELVVAPTPEVAALRNQEAVLKEQYSQLQVTGAEAAAGSATGGVELVTPAQPPAAPSSPKPVQDTLLGLLAGLILGLAAAFLHIVRVYPPNAKLELSSQLLQRIAWCSLIFLLITDLVVRFLA